METLILFSSLMAMSIMAFASPMPVEEEETFSVTTEAAKVNVEFYLESLCPFCKKNVTNCCCSGIFQTKGHREPDIYTLWQQSRVTIWQWYVEVHMPTWFS
ncbi:Uncharacterised protein r2_g4232 [Pycnogonum litorale]